MFENANFKAIDKIAVTFLLFMLQNSIHSANAPGNFFHVWCLCARILSYVIPALGRPEWIIGNNLFSNLFLAFSMN